MSILFVCMSRFARSHTELKYLVILTRAAKLQSGVLVSTITLRGFYSHSRIQCLSSPLGRFSKYDEVFFKSSTVSAGPTRVRTRSQSDPPSDQNVKFLPEEGECSQIFNFF